MLVIKRDGSKEEFKLSKILSAVQAAFSSVNLSFSNSDSKKLNDFFEKNLKDYDKEEIDVDEIHNLVEHFLMKYNYFDVSRSYIQERYRKALKRAENERLIKGISEKLNAQNVQNQNANVDERSFGGRIGEASRYVTKDFALNYCMSRKSRNNHLNNEIYIHDLDSFSVGSHNCAHGKSWIKVKYDDEIFLIRIEEFAEKIGLTDNKLADVSNSGWQILSRDGWTKLKNISQRKLKDDEEIYTIKTRTGIPLKLTGEHRLPILDENNVEKVVKVKDLKVGDSLLDIENIHFSEKDLHESFLNLIDLNDDIIDLRITNLSPLKNYLAYRYNVNFTEIAREDNFIILPTQKTMKLSDFMKLTEKYPLPLSLYSDLLIKSGGSKHSYPLHIPYTPQLAKLYAYIYADGGVYVNEKKSKFQITFANTNEKLIDDFIDCYEVVFGYRLNKSYPNKKATSPCIRITDGTRLVVKLFKDFAGARKNGSNDISIPDFVINGSEEIKYAYLSACIDTDGSISSSKRGVFYSSCCERYCQQLMLLLRDLGYHPTIHQTGKKGDEYHFKGKVGKRNFDSFDVNLSRNDEISQLQSKMNCLKYRDTYAYKGLKNKFAESKIRSIVAKHEDCSVYDMETSSHWYIINNYVSHNCLTIPFDDLLAKGFDTRQVDIRPANSINTAFQLIAVIFQIQSLQQFGK